LNLSVGHGEFANLKKQVRARYDAESAGATPRYA
jgi:hypothetical protein